jgi:3-methyladenine DNA glycosylase/8-oxoguanine DNA glycosylase
VIAPDLEGFVEVGVPLDLARTAAASTVTGRDQSISVTPHGVWRALRTSSGPATVWLRPQADGVAVSCWGPGAEHALGRVPGLLGLADPTEALEPDPTEHPLVAELARRRPGWRFAATGSLVDALVATIVAQRVTAEEAAVSYRSLVAAFGEPAPGPPGLRLGPDPARLAELTSFQLHRTGIERSRAVTIIGLCRRSGSVERLVARGVEEASRALASLPGVGAWTITTVRQVVFGDADAAVVGDYHLPHLVAHRLAGEARASDERMLELLAPFAGHRGRVQRLLVSGGGPGGKRPPKRGPRRRIEPMAWR